MAVDVQWALFGATIALCLLAGWYAWETRRIVERMDKERQAREHPRLWLHVVPWQAGTAKLRIQNVGAGPAFDIEARVMGLGDSETYSFPWNYTLLLPGQFEEFGFPAPDGATPEERFKLEAVRARIRTLQADFTYKTGTGKQYRMTESFDLGGITDAWLQSQMMATADHPDRIMPRIAKSLEDIATRLSR